MRLKLKKKGKRRPPELIFGFRKIERPPFMETLVFPAESITALNAEQVSDLHSKYTLLYAYANQSLAETNVTILRLQGERNAAENRVYRRRKGINSLEKWRKDAIVREDADVQQITQTLNLYHTRRTTFEMLLQNFERFINALSRELSRKNYERNPSGF